MSGFTLPSATLLAQSILSGVFVGALYGLLGLGLSLSWGLLRLINLAHFAFAFLAAYLCYQMATKSLDDKAIGTWLKANRVDTIQGRLRFDGVGNYGDDLMRVKQVQNGNWTVVWPREFTHGGAKLLAN